MFLVSLRDLGRKNQNFDYPAKVVIILDTGSGFAYWFWVVVVTPNVILPRRGVRFAIKPLSAKEVEEDVVVAYGDTALDLFMQVWSAVVLERPRLDSWTTNREKVEQLIAWAKEYLLLEEHMISAREAGRALA